VDECDHAHGGAAVGALKRIDKKNGPFFRGRSRTGSKYLSLASLGLCDVVMSDLSLCFGDFRNVAGPNLFSFVCTP
jgi:hypothetical protein